jgi:hypothetical protein
MGSMDEGYFALQAALPHGWVVQRIERDGRGGFAVLVWRPKAESAELLGELWGTGTSIPDALADARARLVELTVSTGPGL